MNQSVFKDIATEMLETSTIIKRDNQKASRWTLNIPLC